MFVLVAVGLCSGFVVWQLSKRASDEAYDKVLGAAALSIAETISFGESGVTVDIPYAAFAILGTSGKNRIFYRIVDPNGAAVTGTPVLGIERPLLHKSTSYFFDSHYRGEEIRVAQIAHYFKGSRGGGWFNIFVGETREARNQLATRLASFALLPAILAIALGLILIILSIRSSFSPLREIEESIRNRNPSDMSPIDVEVPIEVETLVGSINLFMARLEATLEGLRQVTADAAHQLRTPLAAMRALSELAMDTELKEPIREYVQRINNNAISATTLANQLMTEAQLLHSLETESHKQVDLNHLCRKVARHTMSELRFQTSLPEIILPSKNDTPLSVVGNEAALAELIKNLLINAIMHGEGPVEIRLGKDQSDVRLTLLDRGPGIPEAIKDTLFDRFIKDPNKRSGTGLGLSIVQQIVAASGGKIWYRHRKKGGLAIEVLLRSRPQTKLNRGEAK